MVFVPTLHKSHLCFYCLTDTIEHRRGSQTPPTLNRDLEGRTSNNIESRSSSQSPVCYILCGDTDHFVMSYIMIQGQP